jgi:prepilin signal peptidase PulO-like enzyme (type II secretory pathway)
MTWIIVTCQPHVDPEDYGEPGPVEEEPTAPEQPERQPLPLEPLSRTAGWVAGGLVLALLVGLFLDDTGMLSFRHAPRALLPLIFLFVLIVSESTVVRDSDRQIIEAIDEERHAARKMVLAELTLLLPALLLGLVGLWVMRASDWLPGLVHEALHTGTRVWDVSMMRSWSPLQGLATAATGYVIAGAIGWAVRIVFTLAFGKEAFGTGDIHLMAATGCVAGWPVVLLGFFLACLLALLGWVLSLPFKRPRALPLGPWLSLSFLTVVVFYDPILKWPPVARAIWAARMLFLENSQIGLVEVLP